MKARERGWGKGRTEKGTGIERGRSRSRNFLNYKCNLEKKWVGPVWGGGRYCSEKIRIGQSVLF